MPQYNSYHRKSTPPLGPVNHSLHAKDFDELWTVCPVGRHIVYWCGRSLAADCDDPLPGIKRPRKPPTEQSRARAVRNWARAHAEAGEGYLTQARRSDGAFDYRITRARTAP